MIQRVLIFANPIAGRGKGRVIAARLERAITAAGFSVQTFFDRPGDVAPAMLQDPVSTAIAIGGDGTLRAVVNLFFNHADKGPLILPVPMGTANLMGQHLGIHWPNRGTADAVIAALKSRRIVRLDAGRANGNLFLLMAGVGIDAQVVHLLDRVRRGPINMASYLLPAAMTFASFNFPPITVSVDDKVLLRDTPAIAMIGNVREYGIGVPVLPDAVPNDGLLDVCVMPCSDRRQLIEILVHIAAGEHITRDDVVYTRGKTARVESTEPVAIQVDGDSAGFTPLQVEVLPAHVPFLLPG